jgi:hypothetical protein
MCGLFKYLQREVDGMTILHTAVQESDVRLPAQGTKIYKCLVVISMSWPGTIKTMEVAKHAELNGKETAALINVLSARRLVERIEERRGLIGGSVWRLSRDAAHLLKLARRD